MLRKILLSTLAAGALMATVVVPTQASPHHRHGRHHRQHRAHYRTWGHREFCSWGEANAWIAFQRRHGYQCYYEWHGPNCWVFYR